MMARFFIVGLIGTACMFPCRAPGQEVAPEPTIEEMLAIIDARMEAANGRSASRFSRNTPKLLLRADFERGEDGFVFVRDAFRGTQNPAYARGLRTPSGGKDQTACLRIELGGVDGGSAVGMSGGWRMWVRIRQPARLTVRFDYRLTLSSEYESNEYGQALLSFDGKLHGEGDLDRIAQVTGNGNGGLEDSTGWRTFEAVLPNVQPGTHDLIIGGYNNRKTANNEFTTVLVDNVQVVRGGAGSTRPARAKPAAERPAVLPVPAALTTAGGFLPASPDFDAMWSRYTKAILALRHDEARGHIDRQKGMLGESLHSMLTNETGIQVQLFAHAVKNLDKMVGESLQLGRGLSGRVTKVRDGKMILLMQGAELTFGADRLSADRILKIGLAGFGDPKTAARASAFLRVCQNTPTATLQAKKAAAEAGIDTKLYDALVERRNVARQQGERERQARALIRKLGLAVRSGKMDTADAIIVKIESAPYIATEAVQEGLAPLKAKALRLKQALAEREGLAAHWTFDEGVGRTARDRSGNGNHGRVVGPTWVAGKVGKALRFDGVDDYVDVKSSPSLEITGDLTIALWVQPAVLGKRQNPFDKCYGGEGSIVVEPTGNVNYIYGTAGTRARPYQFVGMSRGVRAGEWTHLTLVRDLRNMRVRWYKDGVEMSSQAAQFAAGARSSLRLTIGTGYTTHFSGLIDDVRIYKRALDASDIRRLFQRGARGP